MECRLAGETEVLGENLPQRHFCPSQNPTWPDPGLNLGLRGGKPATNRLSYGAASRYIYSRRKSPQCQLSRRLGEAHNQSGRCGVQIKLLRLPGSNPDWTRLITMIKTPFFGQKSSLYDKWTVTDIFYWLFILEVQIRKFKFDDFTSTWDSNIARYVDTGIWYR
jgi:hypothetical protein